MNREQIEKEAQIWAKGEITKSRIERAERAFKVGAEWRINSVWHDASEIPYNVPTLVEYPHTDGSYGYATTNEPAQLLGSITRWAYISDLLPNRKEDDR